MMQVLKATQAQYDAWHGYTHGVSVLRFATDGNGDYVVGMNILNDQAFAALPLHEMQVIAFQPLAEE